MNLRGNNLPINDVEGLLPALGVTLPAGSRLQGGNVTANLNVAGPVDRLVTTGPIDISNATLAGFNVASKLSAIAALAGVHGGPDTVIQTLSSNLRVAPEGIRADNLNVVVQNLGAVTGAGTIAANNALNFRMAAKLANGGGLLGGMSQIASLGQKTGAIPFLVQGTTSNPIFVPDMGAAIGNTVTAPAQGVEGLFGGIFGKKKNH
jgi:AsmA protein